MEPGSHTFQIRLQLCFAYLNELILWANSPPLIPGVGGGVWLEIGVWSLGQEVDWNLSGGAAGGVVVGDRAWPM